MERAEDRLESTKKGRPRQQEQTAYLKVHLPGTPLVAVCRVCIAACCSGKAGCVHTVVVCSHTQPWKALVGGWQWRKAYFLHCLQVPTSLQVPTAKAFPTAPPLFEPFTMPGSFTVVGNPLYWSLSPVPSPTIEFLYCWRLSLWQGKSLVVGHC